MKKLVQFSFLYLLFVLLTFSLHAQSGYTVLDSIKLGGEGGWDYLTVDPAAQQVYVSRGTQVMVVDLAKKAVIGTIPNTTGVHGIALVPDLNKGYTSNGRDSSVTIFDMKTLKTISTLKIDAKNPDAILYDPFSRRVFTFNGGSTNATAINVDSDKVAGTVTLSGKPEAGVSDNNGKIYVNIEDKSTITEFDAKTLQVLWNWPIAPGEEASGLALDKDHHRLFTVCSNNLMIILDSDSGKVIAQDSIGDGVDGAGFDPGTQNAFSTNGQSGTLTIVHEESPTKFTVVDNVVTKRGARTCAVDPQTHNVFSVTADFGPPPPPTEDRPHPRPSLVPGSVELLIIGKK